MSKSIYLVAHYFMRPRGQVKTQFKGWMKDNDNTMYEEKVTITRNLKKDDLSSAKIIIDLSKKSIVRNGWNNLDNFDQLFEFFHEGYPQYTTTVMRQIDPEYLEKFAKPETQNTNTPLISTPTDKVIEVDTSAAINT